MGKSISRTNWRFLGHSYKLTIERDLTFNLEQHLQLISVFKIYFLKLQKSRSMARSLLSSIQRCGHSQRIIIACIWDSWHRVEEGRCLFWNSGVLKGHTGCLSGCTSGSWWINRERQCISRNTGWGWGLGHLNFTGQEGGTRIGEGEKGGIRALCSGKLVWLSSDGLRS